MYVHRAKLCAMPDRPNPTPAPREKRFNLRIDSGLLAAATDVARQYGGVSVVIRALLRKFVAGKITLRREDVLDELLPADNPPKQKKP